LHDCTMTSLGYKVDMDPGKPEYPHGKLSVMTSDTTSIMPAIARELGKLPLCKGLVWAPCFPHVCNLLLLDQLKVPAIAKLLAHSRQITAVFRVGGFRKLFLMCDCRLLLCQIKFDVASSMQNVACNSSFQHLCVHTVCAVSFKADFSRP
jgi:hypothetical protein